MSTLRGGLGTDRRADRHPLHRAPVLFAKLTDEDLETYKTRFGGETAA
ncbi:hypothetical protein [Streptomyces sp. NPDC002172]